jgi:hypothetical protein
MPGWVFWLVTSGVALLGILLISLATAFGFHDHPVIRELTKGFGEAFVIAAFIAATVDQYVKRGLISDLYKYIVGYALPSEIQETIGELTKITIIRRDFEARLALEYLRQDIFRLIVEGSYNLVNCSNRPQEFTPHLDFEKHEDPTLDEFRCDSADKNAQDVKKGNTSFSEKQEGILSVSLKKMKFQPDKTGISYKASFRYSRIVNPRDSEILSFTLPTIRVTVIATRYPNGISIDAGKATVHTKDRWHFDGLFLTNQHIHVRWFENEETVRMRRAQYGDIKT